MLMLLLARLLTRFFPAAAVRSLASRRQREAANDFAGLHERLGREQLLHALMLSRRHFRRAL